MSALNIVFAGTPEFGLPCLDALACATHRVSAIYTQPDRPAGRGRHLQPSAVKTWALAHAIPVYQPVNFKTPEAREELAALQPDLMVVIAYGLLLPPSVLSIPRLGCINVHASLLPRWRGASPIQQAILQGDEKTGVTIMQMDTGLDTGACLTTATCSIDKQETAASLHDKLAQLAPAPLLTTIAALAQGTAVATPQDASHATYAPKITKLDANINWQAEAITIERQIRAFTPWPIAYTQLGDTLLRIHQAQCIEGNTQAAPGTIISINKEEMLVATGKGLLQVHKLQFAGSKVITVNDWINAGATQWVGTLLS